MKIIYRADDGTIFNSMEECYQYEDKYLSPKALGRIKACNEHNERVPITPESEITDFESIYFPDEDSAKAFNKLVGIKSFSVFSAGAWYWNSNIGEWRNLGVEMEKLAKIFKGLGLTSKIM